ncbi:MAG: FtsQ-type POTRA domain-containing protein [Candidatus Riflebacteria bacterium]|nr:FtsQ-type POTRA domain-containing protein [Candidatus Riflebacteria bacterium]
MKILLFTVLMAVLSYVAVVQLKHLFFETSYFEIKKIEVLGNNFLKRESVLNQAGVSLAMNLLNLDREAIRSRLMKNAYVKKVSVDLVGLYTLKILIEERFPVMYLKARDSFIEVSNDGIVLSSVPTVEKDLPIVTGLQMENKKSGDDISDSDSFLEARKWVVSLEPRIQKKISELNLSNIQNPYIFFVTGEKIIPKNLEDFLLRFDFLSSLLDNLKKNNVEPDSIDMRAPSEIVVKPKRAKKAAEGSSRRSASG